MEQLKVKRSHAKILITRTGSYITENPPDSEGVTLENYRAHLADLETAFTDFCMHHDDVFSLITEKSDTEDNFDYYIPVEEMYLDSKAKLNRFINNWTSKGEVNKHNETRNERVQPSIIESNVQFQIPALPIQPFRRERKDRISFRDTSSSTHSISTNLIKHKSTKSTSNIPPDFAAQQVRSTVHTSTIHHTLPHVDSSSVEESYDSDPSEEQHSTSSLVQKSTSNTKIEILSTAVTTTKNKIENNCSTQSECEEEIQSPKFEMSFQDNNSSKQRLTTVMSSKLRNSHDMDVVSHVQFSYPDHMDRTSTIDVNKSPAITTNVQVKNDKKEHIVQNTMLDNIISDVYLMKDSSKIQDHLNIRKLWEPYKLNQVIQLTPEKYFEHQVQETFSSKSSIEPLLMNKDIYVEEIKSSFITLTVKIYVNQQLMSTYHLIFQRHIKYSLLTSLNDHTKDEIIKKPQPLFVLQHKPSSTTSDSLRLIHLFQLFQCL